MSDPRKIELELSAKQNPGTASAFDKINQGLQSVDKSAAKAKGTLNDAGTAAKKAGADIQQAGQAAAKAASGWEALTKKLLLALSAFAFVQRAVRASANEFAQKERAVTSLNAALAGTAQLTDEAAEKFQVLANAMAARTGTDDAEWIEVFATLTKFGANAGQIDKLAAGVMNLSGATGQSLPEAASMLGKALQGQMGALTRYGFQVDESKTKVEQLDEILDQAARRGAGQLEARAKTLSGQFGSMKIALGDLGGAIVGIISSLGFLQFWMLAIQKGAQAMTNALGDSIPRMEGLRNVVGETSGVLESASEQAGAMTESTNELAEAAERAADALEREKEAMAEQSSQQVKMIEANAKLKAAQIKASNLPAPQKELLLAQLEQQKEGAIFQEKQRADGNTIRMNRQAGQDMNADLLAKETTLAEKEAAMKKALEADQLRANATRARDNADRLKEEFAAQPNALPDDDYEQLAILGGVSREEYNVALKEQRQQMQMAEAAAVEAEQKASEAGEPGNASALSSEFEAMKKEVETLRQKYQEQQQKLDRETERRQRELNGRQQIHTVESATRAIDAGAEYRGSTGQQAPRTTPQPPAPPVPADAEALIAQLRTAIQTRDVALTTGLREVVALVNTDIRNIQTQMRRLEARQR